jgi:hypothetical protein
MLARLLSPFSFRRFVEGANVSFSILSNIVFSSKMPSSIFRSPLPQKILLRITLFSAGILLSLYVPLLSQAINVPQNHADSLKRAAARAALRDSAIRLADNRRLQYDVPSTGRDPYTITTSMIFNSDAASPSEALSNSATCQSVNYGLSNRMNRFLVYGNPAPLAPIYPAGSLIGIEPGPLGGSDGTYTTEFSQINLLPGDAVRYDPYPGNVMVPEGCFSWENGVFKEDIFDVRFARPISEQVAFSFFSNYRHFDGTSYSHDNNSISTFYQSLNMDTSQLSNQGYNPLTDEYSAGGRIQYAGLKGNEWSLGLSYTDCSNELALNATDDNGNPEWALLHQFRSNLDFESSGNRLGPLSLNFEGLFESDDLSNLVPQTSDTSLNLGGNNLELSLAGLAALPLPDSGNASLLYRATRIDRIAFDTRENHLIGLTPELSLNLPVHSGHVNAIATACAGYEILTLDSLYAYAPTWSLGFDAKQGSNELRLFARESALPYDIPYDSSLRPANPALLDRYRAAGAELSMQAPHAGLVVGGQAIDGVDSETVARAWPMGIPPYQQPSLVLLAAPSIGPWRGITLSSRTMFSDRKPVMKNATSISFITHPADTREYIESRFGFDYWSPRDTITYAGINTWNREIYDLNLEIATHVRTFRFFAKIDNLLNRRFAYVPGYYSPGLTFRWGIDWYLQK